MSRTISIRDWFVSPSRQAQSFFGETVGYSEHDGLLPESVFEKMVLLERKKSERSGRPFYLVTISIDHAMKLDQGEMKTVMWDLSLALDYSTREIDQKGWYVYNSVVGIICTDVKNNDISILTDRLYYTLNTSLNIFQILHLRICTMVYPEISGIIANSDNQAAKFELIGASQSFSNS